MVKEVCDITRGIKNISGVSCHVSSALQVVFHAIPPEHRCDMITLSKRLKDKLQSKLVGGFEDSTSRDVESGMFLVELGHLFELIASSESDHSSEEIFASTHSRHDGADPSSLYKFLPSSIASSQLGDAAASLRSILKTMSQALEECMNGASDSEHDDEIKMLAASFYSSISPLLWKGVLINQIVGSKIVQINHGNEKDKHELKRLKHPKSRSLNCPLTIPVRGKGTVKDSLTSVIAAADPIAGYNWESVDQSEYSEEEKTEVEILNKKLSSSMQNLDLDLVNNSKYDSCSISSSSSDSSESSSGSDSSDSSSASLSLSSSLSSDDEYSTWKTSRVTRCTSLPQILLLQLNRSEFKGGKIQLMKDPIDVEFELNLNDSVDDSSENRDVGYIYSLIGAVVHTGAVEGNSSDDNEHGHYISYMKGGWSIERTGEIWKKIDDEKVTTFFVTNGDYNEQRELKTIRKESLCALFGGKAKKKDHFATLLMYKLKNNGRNESN